MSRRLHTLLARRVVHIDVEIAAAALGYHAQAKLWLRVHPSAVKNAGRTLAREPEIAFAAAVSGPHNLHAVAHCRDLDELFEFTSERLGSLAGLQSMEVSAVTLVPHSIPGAGWPFLWVLVAIWVAALPVLLIKAVNVGALRLAGARKPTQSH